MCVPCIFLYFHIFSVKIARDPGGSLSELLLSQQEKKFCFFGDHQQIGTLSDCLSGWKKFCLRPPLQKGGSLSDCLSGEKIKKFFSWVPPQSVLDLFREIVK